MASDGPSSEDLINQAKESVRPIEPPETKSTDLPADRGVPPDPNPTVTDRLMLEGQFVEPAPSVSTPSPAPVQRSEPEPYVPNPRSREVADVSLPAASAAPVSGSRNGRVLQFFGVVLLVLVALLWILLLSAYADDPVDLIAVFGGGLLVTLVPGILGLVLLGTGDDRAAETAARALPETPARSGRFVRFVGWIILLLIALAWIVLLIGLFNDPRGFATAIFGAALISTIPARIGLALIARNMSEVASPDVPGSTTTIGTTTEPSPTRTSIQPLDPEVHEPEAEPQRTAESPQPAAPTATVGSPRKGRVQRFFGWIVLIGIALAWLRMLTGLTDVQDVMVSIGVGAAITLIPGFVGLMLIVAGADERPDISPTPGSGGTSPRGQFLLVLGWILLLLIALAWILLIVALIGDPGGAVGIIIGGLVVSIIPIFVALLLLTDGDTANDDR